MYVLGNEGRKDEGTTPASRKVTDYNPSSGNVQYGGKSKSRNIYGSFSRPQVYC